MYHKHRDGLIEVITGPMFSGKSEELIKRIRILLYAEYKVLVIKPKFDNRFSSNEIVSRNGLKVKTLVASNVNEIKKLFNKSYNALVIDEVQFFDSSLINYVDELSCEGIRIILSGLDQNYLRQPFGIMPQLLSIADDITKLHAVCLVCKNAATCSFRKTKSQNEFELGDFEEYEARCRYCHKIGMDKQ